MSAIVFAYLNGELSRSFSQREGKHRALDALLAFWKPYALRAQQADPEVVQAAARSSLEALSRQMRAVGEEFGVELPVAQPPTDLEALVAAVSSLQKSVQESSLSTPSPYPEAVLERATEEVIFVEDADLLGDLE